MAYRHRERPPRAAMVAYPLDKTLVTLERAGQQVASRTHDGRKDDADEAERFLQDMQGGLLQTSGALTGAQRYDGHDTLLLYIMVGFFSLIAVAGLIVSLTSPRTQTTSPSVNGTSIAYWLQNKMDEIQGHTLLTQCEVDQAHGGCRTSTEQALVQFNSDMLLSMFIHFFTYGPSSLDATSHSTEMGLDVFFQTWLDEFIAQGFLDGNPISIIAMPSPQAQQTCLDDPLWKNETTNNTCRHVHATSTYTMRLSSPCGDDLGSTSDTVSCILKNLLIFEDPFCVRAIKAAMQTCTLHHGMGTGKCCDPSDHCADLQTEKEHCGDCYKHCGDGFCQAGVCVTCDEDPSVCVPPTQCMVVNPFWHTLNESVKWGCCVPLHYSLATNEPCVDCCEPTDIAGEPVELACLGGYDKTGCCLVEGQNPAQPSGTAVSYNASMCCSGTAFVNLSVPIDHPSVCCALTGLRSWTLERQMCCDTHHIDGGVAAQFGISTRAYAIDGPVPSAPLSCLWIGRARGPDLLKPGQCGIPGTQLGTSLATFGLLSADDYCEGNAGYHTDAFDWSGICPGFQDCCRAPGQLCDIGDSFSCCYGLCDDGICLNATTTPPLRAVGAGCSSEWDCATGHCNVSSKCAWPNQYNTAGITCRRDYDCRQAPGMSPDAICMFYEQNPAGGSTTNWTECCLPVGATCTVDAHCCDYFTQYICGVGNVCVVAP